MAKLQKNFVNFTQVSNTVLNDERLSFKAKWVYAYLFSKPDDWLFSADRIKNDSTDWRDSVQSALKELENFWYLQRKKQGDGSIIYFLDINPKTENPTLGTDPKQEKPKVGKTQSGKIRLINNIDNNTNTELYTNTESEAEKIEKKKNSITIEDLSFIPNKNLKDGIVEFFHYRKAIKKPLKKESLPAFFRQLERLSFGDEQTALAILEQSIANSWQWIFPFKTHQISKTWVWQA